MQDGKVWLDFFQAFDALAGAGVKLPDPENPGNATWPDVVATIRAAPQAEPRDRFIASYRALLKSGVAMADFDNPPAMSFADVAKAAEDLSAPAFASILFAFNDEGDIAQNVGMPCYLDKGAPPEKSDQACSKTEQRQPDFDGRQSFYNSGIIPYEGGNGNTFKVKLADDIEPGTYLFYCAVHGPGQLSEIEVKDRDAEVPSQGDVARETRREITAVNEPLEKVYREAVDNNRFTLDDEAIEGPFAGLYSPKNDHALINEFIPRELRVKAGEPVTWKMFGSDHTISFGVPRYFPIIDFSGGRVKINAKLGEPAGGAPEAPDDETKVDAGTYDGTGFWSSGLVGAQPFLEYTVRVSKPGTYDYACLIHPPMVGKLVVT